jgi:hypothetical protein
MIRQGMGKSQALSEQCQPNQGEVAMATDEQKAAATRLVDDFRTRTFSKWGATLDRGKLADGLIARIKEPSKISSANSQLCGAASVIYNLAQADPAAYAKLAIDLFENGKGTIKMLTITPSPDLLSTRLPAGNDPADWIVLASLRDSENWVFTYHGDGRWRIPYFGDSLDDAKAIQMPHTVASWYTSVGYTDVRNETNLVFTKDWDDVAAADRLHRSGYMVSLFINSNMLSTKTQGEASTFPDHWVGLMSPILSSTIHVDPAATVSATIYTWGQDKRDVNQDVNHKMTVKQFLANFYGYVAGKP